MLFYSTVCLRFKVHATPRYAMPRHATPRSRSRSDVYGVLSSEYGVRKCGIWSMKSSEHECGYEHGFEYGFEYGYRYEYECDGDFDLKSKGFYI